MNKKLVRSSSISRGKSILAFVLLWSTNAFKIKQFKSNDTSVIVCGINAYISKNRKKLKIC